jgi:hypothetical protein
MKKPRSSRKVHISPLRGGFLNCYLCASRNDACTYLWITGMVNGGWPNKCLGAVMSALRSALFTCFLFGFGFLILAAPGKLGAAFAFAWHLLGGR